MKKYYWGIGAALLCIFGGNRMYPASPGNSGIRIRFCPE